NEEIGDRSDTTQLISRLTGIFKQRESNGIFRLGTNDIEKTLWIKAAPSSNYTDVLRLIDAVKISGAEPIGLQLDDLSDIDFRISPIRRDA
ncbi:MAG: hypothetical protein ABI999_06075, partial [Acidobacteriota bacterium]